MIPPAYVRSHPTARSASVDRRRLLLLALEAGQAFLLRARHALERGELVEYATDVRRTQDVLQELGQAPEDVRDGTIAAGIAQLEDLLLGSLALARTDGSRERIDEALRGYASVIAGYRDALRAADAPG